jgi:hypothetical protein
LFPGLPSGLFRLFKLAAKCGNCLCNSAKGSPKTRDKVLGVIRVSVTLCLLFLGVTTNDRASSCSGGDKSLPTGEGLELCSSSLLLLLRLLEAVEVVDEGRAACEMAAGGVACCNRPGAGLKVGGSGNAMEVDVVVMGLGHRGLYMDTGPMAEDLGAALSLT